MVCSDKRSREELQSPARPDCDPFTMKQRMQGSGPTSPLSRSVEAQESGLKQRPLKRSSLLLAMSPTKRSVSGPSTAQLSPEVHSEHHHKSTRRRSFHSLSTATSPGSATLASFVGSYENSLLSGRMSQSPSRPLPFLASIGVISSTKSKTAMPDHLRLNFDAFFYDHTPKFGNTDSGNIQSMLLSSPTGATSPYVGTVDIEQHYYNQLEDTEATIPKFPGYRIPEKGQLQIIIKNSIKAVVRVFLVPYDLSDMPTGSKTFMRVKTYVVSSTAADNSKGSLRYALQIQFCCPPQSTGYTEEDTSDRRRFYLHRNIRAVFAFRAPDDIDKLDTVYEWPHDSFAAKLNKDAFHAGWASGKYTIYDGPGIDWISCRKARIKRDRINGRAQCEEPSAFSQADSALKTPSSYAEAEVRPPSMENVWSPQQSLDFEALSLSPIQTLDNTPSETLSSPTPVSRQIGFEPGLSFTSEISTENRKFGTIKQVSPTSLAFARQPTSRPGSPALSESTLTSSRPSSRMSDRPANTRNPLTRNT